MKYYKVQIQCFMQACFLAQTGWKTYTHRMSDTYYSSLSINPYSVLSAIFLIYSFIGWIVEVSAFLIQDHKFVNKSVISIPPVP